MARNPRGKHTQRRTTSRAKKPVTIDLDAKDVKVTPTAQAKSAASTSVPKTGMKTAAKPSTAKVETPKSKTAASTTASKSSTNNKSTNFSGKSSPTPKPANNNSGFGKMAAAGLVGGIISLIGASALQNAGILPSSAPTSAQQSSTGSSTTQSVDLTPLQDKISQLQSQIDKLSSATPAAAPAVDLKPIEKRISTLENAPKPQTSSSVSTPAGPSAQTTKQLGELQSSLDGLQASTKKLETGLQELSTSSEGVAAKIKSFETAMSDDSGTNDLISTAIESAIAPLVLSSGKNTQNYSGLEKTICSAQ